MEGKTIKQPAEKETVKQKNLGGRPEADKEKILVKLEPYLKSGLSVRKALKEAEIPARTFYDIKDRDESFRAKIEYFQQYLSVLLNSSLVQHIHAIVRKQSGWKDRDGVEHLPEMLNHEDLHFLQWFATTSNLARDEYGSRQTVAYYDPEEELNKINTIIANATNRKKL